MTHMLLVFPSGKKRIILIVAILVLMIAVVSTVSALIILNRTTFYTGVIVEGVDLSGLSMEEADILVKKRLLETHGNQQIRLNYKEVSWPVNKEDISLRFLTEEALEKAYLIGRTGNVLSKIRQIIALRYENINIEINTQFDAAKLREILSEIKKQIDTKEENAAVSYSNGEIIIKNHIVGRNLDIERNLLEISSNIKMKRLGDMELLVEEILPESTYEDVSSIDSVIAEFYTTFNSNDKNRTHNIKLACSHLNGKILMPMDIFSMNDVLGPRTLENGYKDAPVILKNELIEGPGGGVCQVTTTLYNTVLLSKLDVLERAHHSMPLGYVDPGRDATIAEGSIDFKFQNNCKLPICLSAETNGNRLIIRILGKKPDIAYKVKLVSEVVKEYLPEEDEVIIDPNMPEGEKEIVRASRKGLKAIVYRETYNPAGELLAREKISEDIYKPVRGIVKVNSKDYNIEDEI